MFASTPNGAEQVAGLDAQAEELRGRIRANLFFQGLPTKKQKELLNGQKAYLMSLEDIGEARGSGKGYVSLAIRIAVKPRARPSNVLLSYC